MTDKPDDLMPPPPRQRPPFSEQASTHAPFLYFEEAPAFGHVNGMIKISLEVTRLHSERGSGVLTERVMVAQLVMNPQAALSLRAAIDGALLLASPSGSDAKNRASAARSRSSNSKLALPR